MSISAPNAKWATHEDSPLETEFFKSQVDVNEDGTFTYIAEIQSKILNEQGRNEGIKRLTYCSFNSSIELLEAKTIASDGTEYKVSSEHVEDKALASAGQGFDESRQLMIAYPQIDIGSSIYLKYKFTQTKPYIQNHYSHIIDFASSEYSKFCRFEYRSKRPLYFKINDPRKSLKFEISKDSKNLVIESVKDIHEMVIGEGMSIVNPSNLTWVSISTFDKWSDLADQLSLKYAKILNQKLPSVFQDIVNEASKLQLDEVSTINFVTSVLNDKIRYVGDWRSTEGQFIPRDLDVIANTGFGDCKDFSIVTAAILNALGFKSTPALVSRGIYQIVPQFMPCLYEFNHAILKVIGRDSKTKSEVPFEVSISSYTKDSSKVARKTSGESAERILIREHKRNPKFDKANLEVSKTEYTEDTSKVARKMSGEFAERILIREHKRIPKFDKANLEVSKVYWIDPTNFVSMANSIFQDIEGKMTLVLDVDNPSYEKIPEMSYEDSAIVSKEDLLIDDVLNQINFKGSFATSGKISTSFTGWNLTTSEDAIKNAMFENLACAHLEQDDKKIMILPDLKSRTVRDLKFTYEYNLPEALIKTNMGSVLSLKSGIFDTFISGSPDQVGDLFIGPKRTIKNTILVSNKHKNSSIKNVQNLNFETVTPWIHVKRELDTKGGLTQINFTVHVLQNFISSKDINSKAYKDFKKNVEGNIVKTGILISNTKSQIKSDKWI